MKMKPVLEQAQGSGYCRVSADFGPANTPLMRAICQGKIQEVKTQIDSGSDLNVLVPMDCDEGRGRAHTTPLINAIDANAFSRFREHGREMVELLLENGADPNFHVPQDMSPLEIAVSVGSLSLVRTLLQYKAGVDYQDADGETAFLKVAQRDNGPEMMQELVGAGADIHAVNNLGDNAIALAAWQHHLENVKLLAQLAVDVCAKNNAGETAIDMAETNLNDDPGKQEIISLLKSKCGG